MYKDTKRRQFISSVNVSIDKVLERVTGNFAKPRNLEVRTFKGYAAMETQSTLYCTCYAALSPLPLRIVNPKAR